MFYAKFALITKQMKGPRVESSLHKSKPGVITTEISCSVYDQILPIEVVKMYKDIAVGPGNAVQADTGLVDWEISPGGLTILTSLASIKLKNLSFSMKQNPDILFVGDWFLWGQGGLR